MAYTKLFSWVTDAIRQPKIIAARLDAEFESIQANGAGAGLGDVTGPASASDNAVARFDLTTGKIIQNSGVYIDDSGRLGSGASSPSYQIHVENSALTNTLSFTYGKSAASIVMADFVFDNDAVNAAAVDSGAVRGVARQLGATYGGFNTSSELADLRGGEFHVLRGLNVPFGQTWGIEVGVHSEVDSGWDGSGSLPTRISAGINVSSNHAGWLNTGARNDVAIPIGGADGWKHALFYTDTNGSTKLFGVDRYGAVYAKDASFNPITGVGGFAVNGPAGVAVTADVFSVAGQDAYLRLGPGASSASEFRVAANGDFLINHATVANGVVHSVRSGAVADTLILQAGVAKLKSAGLQVGSSVPFSDSSGTLTLQNVDALDATTEATIEAAIDTLTGVTLAGTISVSGGQLAFPATQSASADANTLDDYEEGTWTPVLTFSTPGDLSVTYSVQVGGYVKIGKMVFVQFTIATSAFTHTTASGNVRITGLPFTSGAEATVSNGRSGLAFQGITKAGYTQLVTNVQDAATYAEIQASGTGVSISNVAVADMPTGGSVVLAGSASYIAAA